jgi:hypothetical protein
LLEISSHTSDDDRSMRGGLDLETGDWRLETLLKER